MQTRLNSSRQEDDIKQQQTAERVCVITIIPEEESISYAAEAPPGTPDTPEEAGTYTRLIASGIHNGTSQQPGSCGPRGWSAGSRRSPSRTLPASSVSPQQPWPGRHRSPQSASRPAPADFHRRPSPPRRMAVRSLRPPSAGPEPFCRAGPVSIQDCDSVGVPESGPRFRSFLR